MISCSGGVVVAVVVVFQFNVRSEPRAHADGLCAERLNTLSALPAYHKWRCGTPTTLENAPKMPL